MVQQTERQQQFSVLLSQNRPLVFSIINKYCCDESAKDDLYQDVSLDAWQAFNGFRGDSKFSTWIGRIARNTAIDRLKSLKKSPILMDNFFWYVKPDMEYEEEAPPPISMSIIDTFSEAEKRTLQYRMDGLTYQEISELTGEPMNRLLIRMHRIKKLLTEGAKRKYIPVAQRKHKQNICQKN
jgi:RNA polymerase sigma-70 factor, ECF subfamily